MKKALIVGVGNYPSGPLLGCIHDAETMQDRLSKNEDGLPNFSVRLLTGVECKGELRPLIEKYFEGNEDVALFYYSGHGHIDSCGGYLVTPDFSYNNFGKESADKIVKWTTSSIIREIRDTCG